MHRVRPLLLRRWRHHRRRRRKTRRGHHRHRRPASVAPVAGRPKDTVPNWRHRRRASHSRRRRRQWRERRPSGPRRRRGGRNCQHQQGAAAFNDPDARRRDTLPAGRRSEASGRDRVRRVANAAKRAADSGRVHCNFGGSALRRAVRDFLGSGDNERIATALRCDDQCRDGGPKHHPHAFGTASGRGPFAPVTAGTRAACPRCTTAASRAGGRGAARVSCGDIPNAEFVSIAIDRRGAASARRADSHRATPAPTARDRRAAAAPLIAQRDPRG